jgi:hypothetical protein
MVVAETVDDFRAAVSILRSLDMSKGVILLHSHSHRTAAPAFSLRLWVAACMRTTPERS